MDYAKLSEERLTSTKLEDYDMITVITQWAINAQLKAMYDKNESLRRIELKSGKDDYTGLEAELYPPTVQLKLYTKDQTVLYFLNIKTATMRYLTPDLETMSLNKESIQFSDARIAVSVDLAFQNKSFADLPSDLRDRLAPSGNYGINQLLIDFNSATLSKLDERYSTYQGNLAHLGPSVVGQLDVFIMGYFKELAKQENRHESLFHYVPLADSNNHGHRVATIAPTNCTFQNIPFLTSGQHTEGLHDDNNDDNMLVYLQVTNSQGRLPPSTLRRADNWVVPPPSGREAERYDGTMVLSRRMFLDDWLLPNLAQFNRASTWVVDEARIDNVSLFKYELHMNGHMGWDEDINWKGIPGDWAEQWAKDRVQSWPSLGGEWFKYEKSFVKDDNGVIQRAWQKASTRNYCFIPVGYNADGKCTITVVGRTEAEFYDHSDLIASTVEVIGTWFTQITLEGADDGKFCITATHIDPSIEKHRDYAVARDGYLDVFLDRVESGLRQLNGNFRRDFVLPGAGDFYIMKTAFNRNMDLLCELKYRN